MKGLSRSRAIIVESQRPSVPFKCVFCPSAHGVAGASCAVHQLSVLINVQERQRLHESARNADQRALHDRLGELESNRSQLLQVLGMWSYM
jgi:hypothetical protein